MGSLREQILTRKFVFSNFCTCLLVCDGDVSASRKVVDFKFPKELAEAIDLKLGDKGTSHDKLVELCQGIFHYSVKTGECVKRMFSCLPDRRPYRFCLIFVGHPHFFNQIFAGLDVYGLAGSWITDTLNTSQ